MTYEIDRREALRYLGCGTQPPDGRTGALVDECIQEVRALARPRTIWREFPMEEGEGLRLAGASITLLGEDIRRHLAGCRSCVLMAATLGAPLEQALRRAQITGMAKAVVMDACATAAIEGVCDALQEEIAAAVRVRDKGITWRFSPGYGDMPLSQQRELTDILDTHRKIGLAATRENILTPAKSVTAVIGVTELPGVGRRGGCGTCSLRDSCAFRQGGRTCTG